MTVVVMRICHEHIEIRLALAAITLACVGYLLDVREIEFTASVLASVGLGTLLNRA